MPEETETLDMEVLPQKKGQGRLTNIDRMRGESNGPLAIPEETDKAEESKRRKQTALANRRTKDAKQHARRKGDEDFDPQAWKKKYSDKNVGLAQAELAFLAGVTDRNKLGLVANMSPETIESYIPQFKLARERMLHQLPSSPLNIAIKKDNLDKHSKDTEFLRDQIEKIEDDLQNLDKFHTTADHVFDLVRACDDPEQFAVLDLRQLNNLLNKFSDMSVRRTQLLKAWTAAQKEWQSHIGYSAHLDAAAAGLKAETVERKKKALGSSEDGDGEPNGGFFG